MSRLEKIPLYLNQGIFKKLFKIAAVSKLTEDQRKLYESNLKAKWDYENSIAFASKEARTEGEEKGRQAGILTAAKKFKWAGIPIVQISETLGLSIEEIEKL